MVYAKGKAMQKKVMDSFQERTVHKTYLALVNGVPGKAKASVRTPIEGQEALTNYELLGSSTEWAAVKVMPVTGRTNQIRIHFARMGHPLLGDAKFGIRKEFKRPFKRTALHAWKLELPHPQSGAVLRLEAPVPADMATLMAELAGGAG
jgi:23S rRNA pseudouridine1911/1915/1917 synthase